MPTLASVPYKFANYKPGQAPQPILADQLNANFSMFSGLSTTVVISISGNTTLSAGQANNAGYEFTGSLTGNATVTWPFFYGFAAIQNSTTSGFAIVCGIAGDIVTVLNGETVGIWSDGVNFFRLAQSGGGIGETGTGLVVLSDSATLTGTPRAPTAITGDISTKIATTAFVDQNYGGLAGNPNVWAGTQQFKAGPIVDVTAYGAVHDGVTDNGTGGNGSIAAAIAEVTSQLGGILYFPAGGTYVCKSGFTVPPGCRVVGGNASTTEISTGGVDVTLVTVDNRSCSIEHITLAGKGAGTDTFGATEPVLVIGSGGVETLVFDTIIVLGGSAISNNTDDTVFLKVTATLSYGSTLITDTGGGAWYIRCKFDQNWPVVQPSGLSSSVPARANSTSYSQGDIVTLSGYILQCQTAGTTPASGAPALLNYGQLITDGPVQWYLAAPVGYIGVDLTNTSSEEHAFIECDFTAPYNYGIQLAHSSAVKITQSTLSQHLTAGVKITNSTGIQISDNTFSGGFLSNGLGIQQVAGTGLIIRGNLISGQSSAGSIGVYVNAGSDHIVEGNKISGFVTGGVYVVSGVTDFVVANNVLTGNTATVVVASGASDYYNIVNNIVHGVAVSDSGSGSHKTLSGNN